MEMFFPYTKMKAPADAEAIRYYEDQAEIEKKPPKMTADQKKRYDVAMGKATRAAVKEYYATPRERGEKNTERLNKFVTSRKNMARKQFYGAEGIR
jgi:hypothetical protein